MGERFVLERERAIRKNCVEERREREGLGAGKLSRQSSRLPSNARSNILLHLAHVVATSSQRGCVRVCSRREVDNEGDELTRIVEQSSASSS